MTGGAGPLVVSTFLAAAVEAVEAVTIMLAIGTTRGWRWAMAGTAVALAILAAAVAVAGPAITRIPLGTLRVVIGTLLLLFGLQWLRKAILRASGLKDTHDETLAFAREAAAARAAAPVDPRHFDGYAFTVSSKGVFLEGLEIVFIVLTFGAAQGRVPLAAFGAALAVVLVVLAAVVVRAPLARVPENALKFAVGILLTAYGLFWAAEGAGADWPGGDLALPVLIVLLTGLSLGSVRVLRRQHGAPTARAAT